MATKADITLSTLTTTSSTTTTPSTTSSTTTTPSTILPTTTTPGTTSSTTITPGTTLHTTTTPGTTSSTTITPSTTSSTTTTPGTTSSTTTTHGTILPTTTTPGTTLHTTTTPGTTSSTTTTPSTTSSSTTTPGTTSSTTTTPSTILLTTTTPGTTSSTTTTPGTILPTTTTPGTTSSTTTTPGITSSTTTTPSTILPTTTTPGTTSSTTTTPGTTSSTTTTPGTTSSTTTTPVHKKFFTFALNELFDTALSNSNSEKYKKYKRDFEALIDKSYRNVPSYQANSVAITRFRSGSVIVDYSINSTTEKLDLSSANKEVAINLSVSRYNVSSDSFSQSGEYACETTVDSMQLIIWQMITILPLPDIQVSTDKVLKCDDAIVPLQCCVQKSYTVEWSNDSSGCTMASPGFNCFDSTFGAGSLEENRTVDCGVDKVGSQTARCNSSGSWQPLENNCVLRVFQNLHDSAKNLKVDDVSNFMSSVITTAENNTAGITQSSGTILSIVEILKSISDVSNGFVVSTTVMENFMKTADVIGSAEAKGAWADLNSNNKTINASSELLGSVELMGSGLSNENVSIKTSTSHLSKSIVNTAFSDKLGANSSTQVNITDINQNTTITIIAFSALHNILPVRTQSNRNSSATNTSINGDVVVVQTKPPINKLSLAYAVKNATLGNPQCVFWNFSLLNGSGGWDSTGCTAKSSGNGPVTCECNHTTSFSVLMSPFTPSQSQKIILDYITYIGVGISMASLVVCLLIEAVIWKSVTKNEISYMRHVAIVNIAFSLLIADICFIIGASMVTNGETTPVGPCSTATFFGHFFYLALFFWMMLSALLLLYRSIMVFSSLSKSVMMAVAFSIGYGAPLLIAVVTVASTAGGGGYITAVNACWLNWDKTKALLAFVIPALTIVAINLLVMVVVLYKILRRGLNASVQRDEKHALLVIAKCVAILTPLFGLTWGFGIGTMVSPVFGLHVVFALLNSLQGFFILVFGVLLDSKARRALFARLTQSYSSSNRTRSTGAGSSSSSGFPFAHLFRRRHVYNVSEGQKVLSSHSSSVSTNTYRTLSD
ncbi:adhesion G-protein coupled receptor F1-like [Trichomycterus rosablanca]|uniref:adhesion G-protein coupled receptor F1-like n=1 Tax=Trichomycterus rosablanca TaxID=2290929 RepID=UPI002F351D8B